MDAKSALQLERIVVNPTIPPVLHAPSITTCLGEPTTAADDHDAIQAKFPTLYGQSVVTFAASEEPGLAAVPLKVGVVLSGGQAPGGHNVIAGLFDTLERVHPDSVLYGFRDGPKGIFTGQYTVINREDMDLYRNQGGFDMIGSGRDKIEKREQFEASLATAVELDLDGIVVVGGDDSNTNACMLGEFFASNNAKCVVVGAPKTIDGDLKSEAIETSFGFDTACRTYSELIGNLQHDILAARKYYHFVRLMGRSASHITLECALQTCPNFTLIGEEEQANKSTLASIVNRLCDMICARAALGKDFGTVLVPEGLVEFIPEIGCLIGEINEVLSEHETVSEEQLTAALSTNSARLFASLPAGIRAQLLLDRDPHGNVQVAKIETEALLIDLIHVELAERAEAGNYKGKFQPQAHYFGYEGRCALPTPFDCSYCYALGCSAARLMQHGFNGYISCVSGTQKPIEEWNCGGTPLTSLMNMERRSGREKPVIKKALTELDGPVFKVFASIREYWTTHDAYRTPGPIQFGTASSDSYRPYHLLYERGFGVQKEHTQNPGAELEDGRVLNYSTLQMEQLERSLSLPDVLGGQTSVCTPKPRMAHTEGSQASIDHVLLDKLYPHISKASRVHVSKPKMGQTATQLPIGTLAGQPYTEPTPLKVGLVFMGRQTPGGHDAVQGMYDSLQKHHSSSELLAFVGGSKALISGEYRVITQERMKWYKSQGGIEMVGRSTDRLTLVEDFGKARETCESLGLDALVMLGGCFTMIHASNLAEWFVEQKVETRVLGIPCGVDGNFKSSDRIETAFGFDTATKVFSQLVGNIETDCASAKKYWYFIKLMGRGPSHIALECALQTHPNVTLIGEEAQAMHMTLDDVVHQLADVIQQRRAAGKNYGVAVLPEGFFGSLADIRMLVNDVRDAKTNGGGEFDPDKLSAWSKQRFSSLPKWLQSQLPNFDSSSGELMHSAIQSERLLAELVSEELAERKAREEYLGGFNPVCHFFGYQARSSMPSVFDSTLALSLIHISEPTRLLSISYAVFCLKKKKKISKKKNIYDHL
eukprot:TRINITY_DN1520_c0_g1_i1.p1 TRINITY_DN1520_c0_g1~~TRINITY_DN1520_c0_g1_i1.p1  ORF type:complete len:1049 (-),score=294.22 TRINITY_DN1520_c0_g1_i1:80-3226(-)